MKQKNTQLPASLGLKAIMAAQPETPEYKAERSQWMTQAEKALANFEAAQAELERLLNEAP